MGYKMWRLSQRIEERVKKSEKYFNGLLEGMQERH
jgi:hypothetical protein